MGEEGGGKKAFSTITFYNNAYFTVKLHFTKPTIISDALSKG